MQKIVLINNSRSTWPAKVLLPFSCFTDNLLRDAYNACPKIQIVLSYGTKHAQFWFGVQFPLMRYCLDDVTVFLPLT